MGVVVAQMKETISSSFAAVPVGKNAGAKATTFGAGRICATEGCRTRLSVYNPERFCGPCARRKPKTRTHVGAIAFGAKSVTRKQAERASKPEVFLSIQMKRAILLIGIGEGSILGVGFTTITALANRELVTRHGPLELTAKGREIWEKLRAERETPERERQKRVAERAADLIERAEQTRSSA